MQPEKLKRIIKVYSEYIRGTIMLLFTFVRSDYEYLHVMRRSWVDAKMWAIYNDKSHTKSTMTGSRTSAVSRRYSYHKSATVHFLEGTGTVARIRIQCTGLWYCIGTLSLGPTRSTTGTYCVSYRTERPAECAHQESDIQHTNYYLTIITNTDSSVNGTLLQPRITGVCWRNMNWVTIQQQTEKKLNSLHHDSMERRDMGNYSNTESGNQEQ